MMRTTSSRFGGLLWAAVVALSLTGCSDEGDPITTPIVQGPVSFAADIQPIFNASCVGCHGLGGNAGMDLRASEAYANLVGTAAENSAGDRVVEGDASASVLFQRMNGMGGDIMPPGGALSGASLDLVERWIDEGAAQN